ncbi:MAG TPA: hypothetical protein DCM54_05255 [Gammaproteobacteria bacterium]|nr:hypothetical protein [Gammaproteobacteria bacterium]
MITGTLILSVVGLVCTVLLITASRYLGVREETAVTLIMKELPQTQCAQCGYPGCRPYAEAIADGAPINRCPPGGSDTIQALADLLGRPTSPLDDSLGDGVPRIARIKKEECIGCTLCLPACPVDAIIGAPQMLHSVINDECTGCELCLPPCPVDCIDLIVVNEESAQGHSENTAPCIHCGECVEVCPRGLAPQELFLHQESLDTLTTLRLNDCIECGLCDTSCPSHIKLTHAFTQAKGRLAAREQDHTKAQAIAVRVDNHESRLEKRQKISSKPEDSSTVLARIKSETNR